MIETRENPENRVAVFEALIAANAGKEDYSVELGYGVDEAADESQSV